MQQPPVAPVQVAPAQQQVQQSWTGTRLSNLVFWFILIGGLLFIVMSSLAHRLKKKQSWIPEDIYFRIGVWCVCMMTVVSQSIL